MQALGSGFAVAGTVEVGFMNCRVSPITTAPGTTPDHQTPSKLPDLKWRVVSWAGHVDSCLFIGDA